MSDLANVVSLDRYRRTRGKDKPDPIVAMWKCRGLCLARIGVTQVALDVLELFNAELRRRREKLIHEDDVMVCPDHQGLLKPRW